MQFNNEIYKALTADIFSVIDSNDCSVRTKIKFYRDYVEIIIRKLCNIPDGERMMLGDANVRNILNNLQNGVCILNLLHQNKTILNDTSHTKIVNEFTELELNNIENCVISMLAFLPINYFEKYTFGSNQRVMEVFSLLPPIIRYKVLEFLYDKYPNNIFIIDKLVLAILKSKDSVEAINWVEDHKSELIKLQCVSDIDKLIQKYGKELAIEIQNSAPDNMYVSCKEKIIVVSETIEKKGIMYKDFSSALPYYKEHGILDKSIPELAEFNDIMNFLYLGRKSLNDIKLKNPYILLTLFNEK